MQENPEQDSHLKDQDDTYVETGRPQPSLIGEQRFSNLPAVFFDSDLDCWKLTRQELKGILTAFETDPSKLPDLNASTLRDELDGTSDNFPFDSKNETSHEPKISSQPFDPEKELEKNEELFSKTTPKKKKDGKGSQALGFIHAIIVALLLAIGIRYFVFEAFKIPSGSMEPTLIGDPSFGDHVAVNKLAYRMRDPRRWEVVVFKKPNDSKNLIKRCVGLPNEDVELTGGDVFVDGKIVRKPYSLLHQFWRKYFRQSDFAAEKTRRNWRISGDWKEDNGSLRVSGKAEMHYIPWERTVKNGNVTSANITDIYPRMRVLENAVTPAGKPFEPAIEDLFVIHDENNGSSRRGLYAPDDGSKVYDSDPNWPTEEVSKSETGRFWQGGVYQVADLKVDLTFIPRSVAGVITINLSEGTDDKKVTRSLTLPIGVQDCQPELSTGDDISDKRLKVQKCKRLKTGKACKVSFMNIDDALYFAIDDELVASINYKSNKKYLKGNEIFITFSNDADITIREITIWRDIFYTPRNETFEIGSNEFFMLGDNSPQSHDSRYFGAINKSALVGRAFMVFWPPRRAQVLPAGVE